MSDWCKLAELAGTVALEELPVFIGELERAKAVAQKRLFSRETPPPEPSGPDRLLGAQQVAEILSVDVRWVYRHADELGAVKLSERCLRFRQSAVEAHVASCVTTACGS